MRRTDPLTHYMLALLLARRLRLARPQARALLVASVAPDVDLAAGLLGWEAVSTTHGTLLGNLFVLAPLALALAWLLDRERPSRALPWCLAGVALHTTIDLGLGLPIIWTGNGRCLSPLWQGSCLVSTWGLLPLRAFALAQGLLLVVGWGSLYLMLRAGEDPLAPVRAQEGDGERAPRGGDEAARRPPEEGRRSDLEEA